MAEGLTANHVLCPSAHDRARNPHRSGIAWSKSAVRVILTNPRYTGRQVRNKQRTGEVLLDVDDVAMGHTGVMRWNARDKWVISKEITHEPLIDDATFEQAQAILQRRGRGTGGQHVRQRTRNPYVFRGLIYCAACDRRTQGQYNHGDAYYRCRFPQAYALANQVPHPSNVYLREDALTGPLDTWLASAFTPHRIEQTITAMADAQPVGAIHFAERAIWARARELARDRGVSAEQLLDVRDLYDDWAEAVRARLISAHRTTGASTDPLPGRRDTALLRRLLRVVRRPRWQPPRPAS
ncbi:recombinase family protein, partial [Micromonospora andamanensis]|uniref:recombinase family protein n=1 Tax=Micromonospora andamanensis TaxID=1287068 RepID=UPI0036256E15